MASAAAATTAAGAFTMPRGVSVSGKGNELTASPFKAANQAEPGFPWSLLDEQHGVADELVPSSSVHASPVRCGDAEEGGDDDVVAALFHSIPGIPLVVASAGDASACVGGSGVRGVSSPGSAGSVVDLGTPLLCAEDPLLMSPDMHAFPPSPALWVHDHHHTDDAVLSPAPLSDSDAFLAAVEAASAPVAAPDTLAAAAADAAASSNSAASPSPRVTTRAAKRRRTNPPAAAAATAASVASSSYAVSDDADSVTVFGDEDDEDGTGGAGGDEDSRQRRREIKLAKNRLSAQQSRQRKRDAITSLSAQVEQLNARLHERDAEAKALRAENKRLIAEVEHLRASSRTDADLATALSRVAAAPTERQARALARAEPVTLLKALLTKLGEAV